MLTWLHLNRNCNLIILHLDRPAEAGEAAGERAGLEARIL